MKAELDLRTAALFTGLFTYLLVSFIDIGTAALFTGLFT